MHKPPSGVSFTSAVRMAQRVAGDPRRPHEEESFEVELPRDPTKSGDGLAEMAGMFSLLLGVASLVFRQRWAAWTSLIFALMSLANMRPAEADGKQMFSGIFVSCVPLGADYLIANFESTASWA